MSGRLRLPERVSAPLCELGQADRLGVHHHRRWLVRGVILHSVSSLVPIVESDLVRWSAERTSGIGLETSLQFAAEGAHVLLADINEAAAHRAAEYVNAQFPNCEAEAIKCDVSLESDVRGMVERAVERWGRLDVLVRCTPSLRLQLH